jgi:hypothetical protein
LNLGATTRNNFYWGNKCTGVSETGNPAIKIYDAGANYSLDRHATVIRPTHHLLEHDFNVLSGLSGFVPYSNAGAQTVNYLLYSNDLTNAAWTKSGVTPSTASEGSPLGYNATINQLIFAANNDYVYQDVTMTVTAGDIFTFSIWVLGTSGVSTSSELYLSIGATDDSWYTEDFRVVRTTSGGAYQRIHCTAVSQADETALRVRIKLRYAGTIKVYGAQLNNGKLLPYIPTTSAAVAIPSGLVTDNLIMPFARTPSAANDTGTTGEIRWDSSYVYVCVGANSWKRAAIAAW